MAAQREAPRRAAPCGGRASAAATPRVDFSRVMREKSTRVRTGRHAHRADATFDHLLSRLQTREIPHWADPQRQQPGINTNHGGRGVYFMDPAGHGLEAITAPYAD